LGGGEGGKTPRLNGGFHPSPTPWHQDREEDGQQTVCGPVVGHQAGQQDGHQSTRRQLTIDFETRTDANFKNQGNKIDHLLADQGTTHGLLRMLLDGVNAVRALLTSRTTPASPDPVSRAPKPAGSRRGGTKKKKQADLCRLGDEALAWLRNHDEKCSTSLVVECANAFGANCTTYDFGSSLHLGSEKAIAIARRKIEEITNQGKGIPCK